MERQKPRSLADQSRLRDAGEAAIIATLRQYGPLSRNELSERANLGRTTVFEIAKALIERGVLIEAPANTQPKTRGRPTTTFALNPAIALFAGVEVARKHIRALLINAAHEQIAYGVDALPSPGDPNTLQLVLALLERIAHDGGVSLNQIKHIGLGFSGMVDPIIPSEAIQQLVSGLETALGVSIKIANNSHLASLAESTWGAARDQDHVLYVHWSSGIGGGWVTHRTLLHGAHGMAGEIGHFPVDPEHGPQCYCGARGCLEMLSGLEALLLRSREQGQNFTDQQHLLNAARQGDETARQIFQDAALHVGRVVASSAILLDPSVVVLGGDVSVLGDLIVAPVRDCIEQMVTPRFLRTIEVRAGQLGELGAVRGAIALVLPQVDFSPAI